MRTATTYEQLVDRIETDPRIDAAAERLDVASAAIGEGTTAGVMRGDWMGHALHPLLTDLPLGCWTAAGLLDLVGGRGSRSAAQRLVGLGLLAVPATAVSGLVDYREVPDRATQRVGAVHVVGNTAATVLYLMSWRRRRRGHHLQGIALGVLGGGVATFTGYLGGHMSFARATGTGPRGTLGPSRDAGRGGNAGTGAVLGVVEVSDLLEVPVDQVHAMVASGALTPIDDDDPTRFAVADVLASRQAGS